MSESIELPLVYTVTQTATLLGISRTHAYELVARGDLAHVRPRPADRDPPPRPRAAPQPPRGTARCLVTPVSRLVFVSDGHGKHRCRETIETLTALRLIGS